MATARFAPEVGETLGRRGSLGIFGGSFDPVHHAHLRVASSALEELGLEAMRWLPNSVPGHREGPQAGAADRLAMLQLALGDEKRFGIDQSELWQTGATYTVNTLTRLRHELGTTISLVFIIGADHLLNLHRWYQWQRLFELAHFAIAERPGHEIRHQAMTAEVAAEYARRQAAADRLGLSSAGCMVRFECPPLDISSSSIRQALATENSVADLLPAAVLDYIESKGLYRTRA